MRADFRGSGVGFPPFPAGGVLTWIDGDDNVLQSVRLLLSTVAGERIMRPDLGTSVAELLFEGDGDQNLRRLEAAVRDALTRHEPRVEVERAEAHFIEGPDGVVQVTVALRVLRTNTVRNIVFPYYIGTGGPLT